MHSRASAKKPNLRRHLLGLTALLLGWALPMSALAQTKTPAEESFQRGREALAGGRYAEACRAFEESQRADPASGALLALAYCQELSGLLASAYANYRAAAELAQREGHPERRDAASEQSSALADRLSVLVIAVPDPLVSTPDLRITLGDTEVSPDQFGTPIPVNGGTYRIAAVSGKDAWATTVTIERERDKKTVTVGLAPKSASTPPARAEARPPPPAPRSTDEDPPHRTLQHVSIALGAISIASLGVGTGAGFVANSKNKASARDGHCDARGCDARGLELRDGALTAAHLSTGFVVAGGLLAAGSITLYLASRGSSNEKAPRVTVNVAPYGGSLALTGAY
jgi:hypothetical protein